VTKLEFQAIFFDFDGVLMDSEPVHCDCWREALAPIGVNVTWQVYEAHCLGSSDRDMMKIFAALSDPPADPARLWKEYPRKKQIFYERMVANPPFVAGLKAFMQELAAQYKLGVVSSSAHDEIDHLLMAAGVYDLLGTVVCGHDAQRVKPAPDPYLLAARNLGVARALVVEDSDAGMESARAAGFEAVRITAPARMIETVRERLAKLAI